MKQSLELVSVSVIWDQLSEAVTDGFKVTMALYRINLSP